MGSSRSLSGPVRARRLCFPNIVRCNVAHTGVHSLSYTPREGHSTRLQASQRSSGSRTLDLASETLGHISAFQYKWLRHQIGPVISLEPEQRLTVGVWLQLQWWIIWFQLGALFAAGLVQYKEWFGARNAIMGLMCVLTAMLMAQTNVANYQRQVSRLLTTFFSGILTAVITHTFGT